MAQPARSRIRSDDRRAAAPSADQPGGYAHVGPGGPAIAPATALRLRDGGKELLVAQHVYAQKVNVYRFFPSLGADRLAWVEEADGVLKLQVGTLGEERCTSETLAWGGAGTGLPFYLP